MRLQNCVPGTVLVVGLACGGPPGLEVEALEVAARVDLAGQETADLGAALRRLDLGYASRSGGEGERLLVAALEAVYRGDTEAAEASFDRVRQRPEIGVAGPAARAHGTLLLGRLAWEEIGRMAREEPDAYRASGLGDLDAAFAGPLRGSPPEARRWESDPAIVPTRRSRWGPPMLEVAVNGRPFSFWLDTGTTVTLISDRTAVAAGIEVPAGGVAFGSSATGGAVALRPVLVRELRLGTLVVTNHPAAVVPAGGLVPPFRDGEPPEIAGILGWPVLRGLVAEIDLARGVTELRQGAVEPRAEPNLFWLGYPVVVAASESGEPLLLGLDTGGSASRLFDSAVSRIGATGSRPREGRRWSVGGETSFEGRSLSGVTLDLDRCRLRFGAIGVTAERLAAPVLVEPVGKVGSDLLARAAVTIDLANGSFGCRPDD